MDARAIVEMLRRQRYAYVAVDGLDEDTLKRMLDEGLLTSCSRRRGRTLCRPSDRLRWMAREPVRAVLRELRVLRSRGASATVEYLKERFWPIADEVEEVLARMEGMGFVEVRGGVVVLLRDSMRRRNILDVVTYGERRRR